MAVKNANYIEMNEVEFVPNYQRNKTGVIIPTEEDKLMATQSGNISNTTEKITDHASNVGKQDEMPQKELNTGWKEQFGDRVSYVVIVMVVIIFALSVTVIALGVKVGNQQQIIQTYIDTENKELSTQSTTPAATTTPNPSLLSMYCSNYQTISDSWRKIGSRQVYTSTNSDRETLVMNGDDWFRFVEPAGTTLPDISPPKKPFKEGKKICETYAVAWIDGSHPNSSSTIVQRTICFSWFKNRCMGTPLSIHIGKCSEDNGNAFYIYQLKRPNPDSGVSAYCAI